MARPLNILIIGHNYAPEPVGIGPCTTGMAEMLAAEGHSVRVICGTPSYPHWTVAEGYARYRISSARENGVAITRLPHFVPKSPQGWWRILHHLSFALLAFMALIAACLVRRPAVIIAIAPSILSTLVARTVATVTGRPLWVHVQDLEVDIALATGHLPRTRIRARGLRWIERCAMNGDRVSSISPAMCTRLAEKGIPPDRIIEFRNWARTDVRPKDALSPFRKEWNVQRPHVALYSGNIAAKQGIEIVAEAARLLSHRRDILFVICGNGPNRPALMAAAAECESVAFFDLQPPERLSDLLSIATVHLLPQIAGAADLVLPSKLPNMLASGRPIITTAEPWTGLAHEVEGCGLVTRPGDAAAFAAAIVRLIDDAPLRKALGRAAGARAAERWSKDAILTSFEGELRLLVAERDGRRLRRHQWRSADQEPLAE